MDFKHFPIDKYLRMKEEHDAFFRSFYAMTGARVAVSQRPGYQFTGAICRYRDRQLENELEYIAHCMKYRSDIMNAALEPWRSRTFPPRVRYAVTAVSAPLLGSGCPQVPAMQ